MREVCSSWKAGFDLTVTRIHIKGPPSSTPEEDRGDWVEIGGPLLVLPSFLKFPELVKLRLSQFSLSNSSLAGLLGSPKLQELVLMGCDGLTPEVADSLVGLPLVTLDLQHSLITSVFLGAIRKLPIVDLGLYYANRFGCASDANLLALSGMPHLQKLDLSGYRSHVSDVGFRAFQGFPQLRKLDLGDWHGKGFTAAGVRDGFRGLPLTSLYAADFEYMSGCFDDENLWGLRGLPLQHLNLDGCRRITDEGMKALEDLPLTDLSFDDAVHRVTLVGIASLKGMPLTNLECPSYYMTDEGLEILKDAPLTKLHLARTVTDVGLASLKGMPLTSLFLSDTQVTDNGLKYILGLPLTRLDLGPSYKVSPFSAEALLTLRSMPLLRHLSAGHLSSPDVGKVTWEALQAAGIETEGVKSPFERDIPFSDDESESSSSDDSLS